MPAVKGETNDRILEGRAQTGYRDWSERASDQEVNQDDDAETQDENGDLLDFQGVFARCGFGRHGGYSFAQGVRLGNGSGVGGTGVTCLKFLWRRPL